MTLWEDKLVSCIHNIIIICMYALMLIYNTLVVLTIVFYSELYYGVEEDNG